MNLSAVRADLVGPVLTVPRCDHGPLATKSSSVLAPDRFH
jgi:hypothetical protein